jgi:hypothetical protein
MKKKTARSCTHTFSPISYDTAGNLSLTLLCPECEAAGVTLSDEEAREALLQVEASLLAKGIQLTDLIAPEAMPEIRRLLGRTKN